MKLWDDFTKDNGDIFECFNILNNPLRDSLRSSRVSYNFGGVFTINKVKSSVNKAWAEQYLDYEIVIDSVAYKDFEKLKEIDR